MNRRSFLQMLAAASALPLTGTLVEAAELDKRCAGAANGSSCSALVLAGLTAAYNLVAVATTCWSSKPRLVPAAACPPSATASSAAGTRRWAPWHLRKLTSTTPEVALPSRPSPAGTSCVASKAATIACRTRSPLPSATESNAQPGRAAGPDPPPCQRWLRRSQRTSPGPRRPRRMRAAVCAAASGAHCHTLLRAEDARRWKTPVHGRGALRPPDAHHFWKRDPLGPLGGLNLVGADTMAGLVWNTSAQQADSSTGMLHSYMFDTEALEFTSHPRAPSRRCDAAPVSRSCPGHRRPGHRCRAQSLARRPMGRWRAGLDAAGEPLDVPGHAPDRGPRPLRG